VGVRRHTPMKRGLKLRDAAVDMHPTIGVRDRAPIKRGLKLHVEGVLDGAFVIESVDVPR
jgi:hypothetical protein